jgi:catechol 2,3-dioxygenase-like lactoylglutathione lyase family enzyme
MTSITSITLEAADPSAARDFYTDAFGLNGQIQLTDAESPTGGFRGFTLSLLVSQPADAAALLRSALEAGATSLKPGAKSLWGYAGVVRAPDGAIWKVACSSKQNSGPATGRIEDVVLLLGVSDVPASKRFYTGHGLDVAKSFARSYVQFETATSPIKLGLYKRRALAKDAGVPVDGSGSHRLVIDGDRGGFTDPDGFTWQAAA